MMNLQKGGGKISPEGSGSPGPPAGAGAGITTRNVLCPPGDCPATARASDSTQLDHCARYKCFTLYNCIVLYC